MLSSGHVCGHQKQLRNTCDVLDSYLAGFIVVRERGKERRRGSTTHQRNPAQYYRFVDGETTSHSVSPPNKRLLTFRSAARSLGSFTAGEHDPEGLWEAAQGRGAHGSLTRRQSAQKEVATS